MVAVSGRFLALATQLEELEWDDKALELRGRALFPVGEEPGEAPGSQDLRIHIASGPAFKASRASAEGGVAKVSTNGSDVVLTLQSSGADSIPFRIFFTLQGEKPERESESLSTPRNLRVTFVESEQRPMLEWSAGSEGADWWRKVAAFVILRDEVEIGRTTSLGFLDRTAIRGKSYHYSVRTVGSTTLESVPVSFAAPAPNDASLDAWSIFEWSQKPGFPAKRRSVVGGPLSIAGMKFDRGLGTRAPSRIDYRLEGGYTRFESRYGIDDAARFQGSVVFVVQVDGVERYRSPVVRGGNLDPVPISVSVTGGQVLSLIVEDAKNGTEDDLADWAEARLKVEQE